MGYSPINGSSAAVTAFRLMLAVLAIKVCGLISPLVDSLNNKVVNNKNDKQFVVNFIIYECVEYFQVYFVLLKRKSP